jgi:hypothetical protein
MKKKHAGNSEVLLRPSVGKNGSVAHQVSYLRLGLEGRMMMMPECRATYRSAGYGVLRISLNRAITASREAGCATVAYQFSSLKAARACCSLRALFLSHWHGGTCGIQNITLTVTCVALAHRSSALYTSGICCVLIWALSALRESFMQL